MNFSKDFPTRLKSAIKAAGFTQSSFAAATGIKQSAISTYCNGKGLPNVEALYSMAVELGSTMEWLLAGDRNGVVQTSDNWKARALEAERKLAVLRDCSQTLAETVQKMTSVF